MKNQSIPIDKATELNPQETLAHHYYLFRKLLDEAIRHPISPMEQLPIGDNAAKKAYPSFKKCLLKLTFAQLYVVIEHLNVIGMRSTESESKISSLLLVEDSFTKIRWVTHLKAVRDKTFHSTTGGGRYTIITQSTACMFSPEGTKWTEDLSKNLEKYICESREGITMKTLYEIEKAHKEGNTEKFTKLIASLTNEVNSDL